MSLAGKITVGLLESNGSLPLGLWLMSPAAWLPRNREYIYIYIYIEYRTTFLYMYSCIRGRFVLPAQHVWPTECLCSPLYRVGEVGKSCWIKKCIFHYTFYTVFTHRLTFHFCSCTPVTPRLATGDCISQRYYRMTVQQGVVWYLGIWAGLFGGREATDWCEVII